MCTEERAYTANAFANLGTSDASDEAVPGVADDAEKTWVAILLGDENGPCAEPNLGAKLPREHKVAERDEQLAGSIAMVAVAEEDGLHNCIGPSIGPDRELL